MSQRQLARALGLSAHSNLVQYELGRRLPPGDIVDGCERVLDAPAGSLQRLRRAALAERAAQPPAAPHGGPDRAAAPAAGLPGGPAVGNLPARSVHFTGRVDLLTLLERRLRPGGERKPLVLHGMAGVGKSQLALAYAHRHADRYDLTWWLPADQPLGIAAGIAALGRRLGLPERVHQDRYVAEVLDAAAGRDRCLLVFDDAATPEEIAPYLGANGRAHVLITSRNPAWGALAVPVEVEAFTVEQARAFLLDRVPGGGAVPAARLAREFGGLPLALEQAAAYMQETGLSLDEYLRLYLGSRRPLLARAVPTGYGASVDSTLRLAIRRVETRAPAAEQLLRLCALLAQETVPHDLVRDGASLLPEPLASTCRDPLAYADAVAVLRRHALAGRDAEGLRLHPLVRLLAAADLGPEAEAAWTTRALGLVEAAWPQASFRSDAWARCGALLPHALAAAERAERLGVAPAAVGRVLTVVGVHLWSRTSLVVARGIVERALTALATAHGPDHPESVFALGTLGLILQQLGDYHGARARLQAALDVATRAGSPQPSTALALLGLGGVLRDLDEHGLAIATLERSLDLLKQVFGGDDPWTAVALVQLANTLHDLAFPAALERARATSERALAIFETGGEAERLRVAMARSALGGVLRDLGQLDASRDALERALAVQAEEFGATHPRVAITLTSLGATLRRAGDPAAARAAQERALAALEASYGPDHPRVAVTLTALGETLTGCRANGSAVAVLRRAVDLAAATLGPQHRRTRHARAALARALPGPGEAR